MFENAEETRTQYLIPEANLPKFEAAIEKLSRRSVKLTGEPIRHLVFGYEFAKDADGLDYKVFNVLISAEPARLSGWTFLARIDHTSEAGNVIRAVPNTGVAVPERYRTAKPHCDHCGINRYRNDTFLLCEEATATFSQVGTTCLKDFFGHDPMKIAKRAELLGYADEIARSATFVEAGQGHRVYVETDAVLQHAAMAIRTFGWVSAKAARESEHLVATKVRVSQSLMPLPHAFVPKPEAADIETAEKTAEWLNGLSDRGNLNDFEHNIVTVTRGPMMEARSIGIASAAVFAYLRHADRLKAKATHDLGASLAGINALFDKMKVLKNPAIVLTTKAADGIETPIRLSVAGDRARLPGTINVTDNGGYGESLWFGRIRLDGTFEASSRVEQPAGLVTTLSAFAADPVGVAAEYGKRTGNCAVCGRRLKDKRSTEVGYGGTCAERLGWPWGATGEKTERTPRAKKEAAVAAPKSEAGRRIIERLKERRSEFLAHPGVEA